MKKKTPLGDKPTLHLSTNNMIFDYLVFIGRMEPLHIGHMTVLHEALRRGKHVIVLVGSANRPRSFRNPWTYAEREGMIYGAFKNTSERERIHVRPLNDYMYNDAQWMIDVQNTVDDVVNEIGEWNGDEPKIGLIGFAKDHSSYYLNLFPQWKKNGSVNVIQKVIYNATDIRKQYFTRSPIISHDIIPDSTSKFMLNFLENENFRYIVDELDFLKKHDKAWENSPYPPTFNTVDSVVIQSGHILLIERRSAPGKGLLALPGGYLNQHETLLTASLRELIEETKIKITENILRGSLKSQHTFDGVHRSERGRIITQVFCYKLNDNHDLPRVKGSDDARKAMWVPFNELKAINMFEDHYDIAMFCLNQLREFK